MALTDVFGNMFDPMILPPRFCNFSDCGIGGFFVNKIYCNSKNYHLTHKRCFKFCLILRA